MASISISNCRKKDVYEKYHLIYEPTKLRSYAHSQHPLLTNLKTSSIWSSTKSQRSRSSTVATGVGWWLELWTHCERLTHCWWALSCTVCSSPDSSTTTPVKTFSFYCFFRFPGSIHRWRWLSLILETYSCQLLRILDWPCVSFPRMGVVYVQISFIWFFDQKIWTKAGISFPP